MTRDGWFFNEGGKPSGPLSIEELIAALHGQRDPHNVLVWNASYKDWRPTKDVPEIAKLIFTPPPIPQSPPPLPQQPLRPDEKKEGDTRRRNSFLSVLLVVLLAGAVFSHFIYNNSPEGIASLFGQLIGATLLCSLFAIPARRKTYTPAIVLALAAFSVGIANAPKLIDAIDVRSGMKALSKNPTQIDQVAKENPSNNFAQLMAGVNKIALQTVAKIASANDKIEPQGLSKDINYATLTPTEMRALLRDLKLARENADAASHYFVSVLADERTQIQQLVQSLSLSDSVKRDALAGLDRRQAKMSDFNSRMIAARKELYSGLENYVGILNEQYGRYTIQTDGQFLFSDHSAVPRFNMALKSVEAASKKLSVLDAERQQLQQAQQEGLERFLKSEP